jgi:hypothetical protein
VDRWLTTLNDAVDDPAGAVIHARVDEAQIYDREGLLITRARRRGSSPARPVNEQHREVRLKADPFERLRSDVHN